MRVCQFRHFPGSELEDNREDYRRGPAVSQTLRATFSGWVLLAEFFMWYNGVAIVKESPSGLERIRRNA